MSRRRLYLEPGSWGPRVVLQDRQKRYLINVLRLEPGSYIDVFDGQGYSAEAVLEQDDASWVLVPGQKRRVNRDGPSSWLGCAVLKGRAFDEVIRQVSEIGVVGIFPVLSQRVVPRLHGAKVDARMQRWTNIAAEAARQSGRSTIMNIEPVREFTQVVQKHPGDGILLHPDGDMSLSQRLRQMSSRDRFVLVGPEGGFSAEEVSLARQNGFSICTLGANILRARTAMVVAGAFSCLDTIGDLE